MSTVFSVDRTECVRNGLRIRRHHTRIIFGEDAARWSVVDPEHDPDREGEFTERDLASEWIYMTSTCPDTKTALKKVRLVRWALRNLNRREVKRATIRGTL